MTRFTIRFAALAAAVAASSIALAAAPTVFGKTKPGLWELTGVDGSKTPLRLCVADLSVLAQVEHRAKPCAQTVLKQGDSTATVSYQCKSGDFGRSDFKLVTANNFRIDTQGISGGLPFGYVVQARRVGDCEPKAAPVLH